MAGRTGRERRREQDGQFSSIARGLIAHQATYGMFVGELSGAGIGGLG